MTTPDNDPKTLGSASELSKDGVLVEEEKADNDAASLMMVADVLGRVKDFYQEQTEIKESHGIRHIMAVFEHAKKAVAAVKQEQQPPLSSCESMEVLVAALLHDMDDHKYFPSHSNYENAINLMQAVGLTQTSQDNIVEMISWVSCSKNKNSVPEKVKRTGGYWRLIPRWADRLEAVGPIGVVRCYQYNMEHNQPLFTPSESPRAQTEEQVWQLAPPERFESYKGGSKDMISHYYDKLLHVSRPPPDIVRNVYLEREAQRSSKELVEVCLRYGKSGVVDEAYIQQLAKEMGN